jgi:hypothetical protein
MELFNLLKQYLLKEEGFLKTVGKEAEVVLKDLENLGKEGKSLRTAIKSIDSLEPEQFAKLERSGVNVAELVQKAEKATTQNADTIAKEIDDVVKGQTKAGGEVTKSAKTLSAQQQINKDFDALLSRADKLESAGQKVAANNVRRRAFELIGEDFEEATKLPGTKAEEWAKLNTQRTELLKNPNTPKKILDDVQKQMDSIYPRTSWEKIRQWARENPKKAWLFGFLGAGALGTISYQAYQAFKNEPSPTPKPGKDGKACSDTLLKIGCRGENVKKMQQRLVSCGYELPKYGVDGIFKNETKSAVMQFQVDSGLKVDGIAGKDTLAALSKCPIKKTEEVSPAPKSEVDVEPTAQDQEDFRKAQEDFAKAQKEREELRKQYSIPNEKSREVELPEPLKESLTIQKDYFLNPIKNRHEQLEKLIFERMVKGCK